MRPRRPNPQTRTVEMQNRDEGLISAGNALQLESHAKINSGKTMNLRDKRKDNARASNFGKYVAVDAVLSEVVFGQISLLTGKLTGKN